MSPRRTDRTWLSLSALIVAHAIASNAQITFPGQTPAPTTVPTTAAPTTVATTAAPVTTIAPGNTCACYAASICQNLVDGAGNIDFRIVTPGGVSCPTGQLYCCPPASAGTTVAPAATCGARNTIPNTLTVASGQAPYGNYPWDVAILTTGNFYVGGGVLLSNRYVLTAAHKVVNYTAAGLKVRTGDWDLLNTVEPLPYQEYGVLTLTVHPNYNQQNLQNDIAIIRLNQDATFPANVGTACLPPSATTVYDGQNCYVSGWGVDIFVGGRYQNIIKEVLVPIVPSATCQQILRSTRLGSFFVLDPTFLCAGGVRDSDACTGDGGSPLVCLNSATSRWAVVGLVSWGIGCGQQGIPGVYVNIPRLLPWIQAQTGLT